MVDTDKNNQYQLDLSQGPEVGGPPPELPFLIPPEPPRDTPLQGALKEAKRLAIFSASFGIMIALLLGGATNLVAFWMTGKVGQSAVGNVLLYALLLALVGASCGAIVGGLNGAFKAWLAGRRAADSDK